MVVSTLGALFDPKQGNRCSLSRENMDAAHTGKCLLIYIIYNKNTVFCWKKYQADGARAADDGISSVWLKKKGEGDQVIGGECYACEESEMSHRQVGSHADLTDNVQGDFGSGERTRNEI